jgi:hypothetical protein
MERAVETSRRRRHVRRSIGARTRRPLRPGRAGAVAAAAFLLAGGGAAAFLLASGGGGGQPAPVGSDGVSASGTVARAALFGDQIQATLSALVDTRRVQPRSVQIVAYFPPYIPVSPSHSTTEQIGPLERITWHVVLDCVTAACLPPDPIREGRRLVLFPPAQVLFHTRRGALRSRAVPWPSLELASRMTAYDMIWLNPYTTPPFHATATLARPTYRLSPVLLEVLTAGLGALLLAAAALLGLRAVVRTSPKRRDELDPRVLAAMTPLERAMLVLERARLRGGVEERRKALERVALELRLHGDERLGDSARALAWSVASPTPDAMADLADAVQRTSENGRNGDAP